jgi:hypothetical protein
MGHRPYEWAALAERTYPLFMLGRWNEVLQTADEFTQEQVDSGGVVLSVLQAGVETHVNRGELDEARRIYAMFARLEQSSDVQDQSTYAAATAALRLAEGRFDDALQAGLATLESARVLGATFQGVKTGVAVALDAAQALGALARVDELLAFIDGLPPGSRPLFLVAHAHRVRGRIAGDAGRIDTAIRSFRELDIPLALGISLLDHAELTGSEASLAEARDLFEQLGARPWLERAAAAAPSQQIPA